MDGIYHKQTIQRISQILTNFPLNSDHMQCHLWVVVHHDKKFIRGSNEILDLKRKSKPSQEPNITVQPIELLFCSRANLCTMEFLGSPYAPINSSELMVAGRCKILWSLCVISMKKDLWAKATWLNWFEDGLYFRTAKHTGRCTIPWNRSRLQRAKQRP